MNGNIPKGSGVHTAAFDTAKYAKPDALPPDAGFPDEAIDAAIDAMGPSRNCECTLDSDTCEPCVMTATTALLAAQPAWEAWLRGVIADEVIRNGPVLNWELNPDGTEDALRAAYVEAFRDAAAIIEQGRPDQSREGGTP